MYESSCFFDHGLYSGLESEAFLAYKPFYLVLFDCFAGGSGLGVCFFYNVVNVAAYRVIF